MTTLYIKWHRKTASVDAIAYAAKIRDQEASKSLLSESESGRPNCDIAAADDDDDDDTAASNALDQFESQKKLQTADIRLIRKESSIGNDQRSGSLGENPDNIHLQPTSTSAANEAYSENPKDYKKNDKSPDEEYSSLSLNDYKSGNNQWRCACEGGFLPTSMLGGAGAVFNMGIGNCYHTKGEMK